MDDLFVLAAEVAIDAGQHVIASEGLRAPVTFAGVFEELAGRLAPRCFSRVAGETRV